MEERPIRGPLALSEASWNTSIPVYALPKQWCVHGPDKGCEEEIILHCGHTDIQDYYLEHRLGEE